MNDVLPNHKSILRINYLNKKEDIVTYEYFTFFG